MIPVVGRRMNLLLASSSSLSIAPLLPPPPSPPPMWIHTCTCVHCCCPCSRLPSDFDSSSSSSLSSTCSAPSAGASCPPVPSPTENLHRNRSAPFPHRHQGIGLESSCRLDSATCSFRGQSQISRPFNFPTLFCPLFFSRRRLSFLPPHPKLDARFQLRCATSARDGPVALVCPATCSAAQCKLSVQCSTFNKNTHRGGLSG